MPPEPTTNPSEPTTDDQELAVDVKQERNATAESAELSDTDLDQVAGGEGLNLPW